jgi:hypothetical protein
LARPTLFSGLSQFASSEHYKENLSKRIFSHRFSTGALQHTNITATGAFFSHIKMHQLLLSRLADQTTWHGHVDKGYIQLTTRAAHTQLCGKLSQHVNYITTIQNIISNTQTSSSSTTSPTWTPD